MSRQGILIGAAVALGSLATYFIYKKVTSKEDTAVESNETVDDGLLKPAGDETVDDGLLKPAGDDSELFSEGMIALTEKLTSCDRQLFYHNYLVIKRTLTTNLTPQKDFGLFLACMFYAAEVKSDQFHPHRNVLGITAKAIEDDLLDMVPGDNAFAEAARGIRDAIISGEGSDIYHYENPVVSAFSA